MNTKKAGATLALFVLTLGAATGSFAKGHDQGFGAQLAGPATAGLVDDGQSNREGMGAATSYGQTDASIEAKDDIKGKSVVAQDRIAAGHPSN
jgi:hypothetical protein